MVVHGFSFFFEGGFLVNGDCARGVAELCELCQTFTLEGFAGTLAVVTIATEVASLEIGMSMARAGNASFLAPGAGFRERLCVCGTDPDGVATEVLDLDGSLLTTGFAVEGDVSEEGLLDWCEPFFGVIPGACGAHMEARCCLGDR